MLKNGGFLVKSHNWYAINLKNMMCCLNFHIAKDGRLFRQYVQQYNFSKISKISLKTNLSSNLSSSIGA